MNVARPQPQASEAVGPVEQPSIVDLVQFRSGHGLRPLFMIRVAFGDGLLLRSLAEGLRTDRPIYIIEVRSAPEREEPHGAIGEMAEACIRTIRAEQATGPYAIAASGFGGLVAYEVACRLRAAGQAVELLALIGVHFYSRDHHAFACLTPTRKIRLSLRALRSRPPQQWPGYLLAAARSRSHAWLTRVRAREQRDPAPEIASRLSPHYVGIFEEIASYKPPPYDGNVSVLRSAPGPFGADGPLLVLRRAAASVEIYDVRGERKATAESGLAEGLAELLNQCLAKVDPRDNRSDLSGAHPQIAETSEPQGDAGGKGVRLTRLFASLAGRETRIDARRLAIVVAHTDDETIGIGGQLARLEGALLVHLTNGAPRDMRYAHALGFATKAAYAAARRAEFERAMAKGEVRHASPIWFNIDDAELAVHLADAAKVLAELFATHGTACVLTHPYEGGHPDHDATALAVRAAATLMAQAGHNAPDIGEMTFYHLGAEGLVRQDFCDEPASPELAFILDNAAWSRKQRMLAEFTTQRDALQAFNSRFERLRLAPSYDFAQQPNRGAMQHDPAPWRYAVRAALAELRLKKLVEPHTAASMAKAEWQ